VNTIGDPLHSFTLLLSCDQHYSCTQLFASELKTALYHTHKRELLALKILMHIVSCLVLLYFNWYSSTLLIFLATKGRIFWYWNSSNTLNTTDCVIGGMRRVWVWRISSCRCSHMRIDLAIAWLIRVCGTRGSLLQVYLVITMLTVSHF